MKGPRKKLAIALLLLCTSGLIIHRCTRLPSLGGRTHSTALADTANTRLGRAIAPLVAAHPNTSGIHPLRDPRDAFAARCLLARAAQRSLDVQYYIWHDDLSGTLLFRALVDAADRGVRVRLLLDDNNTDGLDEILAALDSHPSIEVRLFNPFVIRGLRLLGYLTDFTRVNHRMHNKSFTADNQASIVGGRNVGDEYFGATAGTLFADLDAIAIGPVVADVSHDFDRYWASESAYPADRLLQAVDTARILELKAAAERVAHRADAVAYMNALRTSPFAQQLVAGTLPLEWAATRMISDPPSKATGGARDEELLSRKMREIFGRPKTQVDLVSPYFVPGKTGVKLFSGWTRDGVKVRVLTNSLDATDVAAVHAGYAKRRRALLKAGVTLYELRSSRSVRTPASFGSSGSSLHAKTFAVDRTRIFIGSFNFDPRSATLNTEMGFVIDSPGIAQALATVFDRDVPAYAYEVELTADGETWLERRDGKTIRYTTEPHASFGKRAATSLLAWLPIEWLL
jgi:putative cardiolipin synthase